MALQGDPSIVDTQTMSPRDTVNNMTREIGEVSRLIRDKLIVCDEFGVLTCRHTIKCISSLGISGVFPNI
jgi:hypothetical protein